MDILLILSLSSTVPCSSQCLQQSLISTSHLSASSFSVWAPAPCFQPGSCSRLKAGVGAGYGARLLDPPSLKDHILLSGIQSPKIISSCILSRFLVACRDIYSSVTGGRNTPVLESSLPLLSMDFQSCLPWMLCQLGLQLWALVSATVKCGQ